MDHTLALKNVTPVEKTGANKPQGMVTAIGGFWAWYDKHNEVDDWDDVDRDEFAADTARRLAICKEAGLSLPEKK